MTEPNIPWQKSSFSAPNGNCIEVSSRAGRIVVRESDKPGIVMEIRHEMLRALLAGVKDGTFDVQ